MKNLIWFIAGLGLLYVLYGGIPAGTGENFSELPLAQSRSDSKDIKQVEFMTLFDQQKPFTSLAENQHYTVVEVYLDTCSICKRLESNFPAFMEKRNDVYIKRVHFPESGMNFTITSQQEGEELQARIESYKVCGTPHIEIYGPEKNLIAADNCANKAGLDYLRRWISTETGISRFNL